MTRAKPKLRKREIALALAAGLLASGAGAVILSEVHDEDEDIVRLADSRELTVGEFTQLETVGPQDVEVTTGDEYTVRFEGNPHAVARFSVSVENGVLRVRPAEGINFDWSDDDDVTVHVTAPGLDSVTLAGSGDVHVDRITGTSFDGGIAGSGTLDIDVVEVDEAKFSIGGSGDIVVAGKTRTVNIEIGGSGTVAGENLQSRTARIAIAGSGDIDLVAMETADISIMGSGDVHIGGPATCTISKIGGGDVQCDSGQTSD
jgi:hypothetical protein